MELRMYFFTNYQSTGIQKGIQCGHAAIEYARQYGDDSQFIRFADKHKTWIILNGGTINSNRDANGKPYGTLNQIEQQLKENKIKYSSFHEPDLQDALTAVCFIADERVFDNKKYPDLKNHVFNTTKDDYFLRIPSDTIKNEYTEYYLEWLEFIGGEKNGFLKDLLKDKKLA